MSRFVVLTLLTALLGLARADAIYTKNSPVLQVNAKTYDSLIAQSNHTSILEFYAPWCGHCQNLKPAYEKAARNLAGLAKVAAINCDDETNKQFCSQMQVQGFPTLKIVKPGSKAGKPIVEDYQGARTAKAIVDTIIEKIPNHVKRLQDNGFEEWLSSGADTPKAILFTEKGTVSALIRSLAIDFLGAIDIGQIRSKETAAVQKFDITIFPSLVLVPGDSQEAVTYSGEMKKDLLVDFLTQAAAPNPDPAPKNTKSAGTYKKSKPAASASSKASSAAPKQPKVAPAEFGDFQEIVLDDDTPLESPIPIFQAEATPVPLPEIVPAIPMLSTAAELESACLTSKSGTCILVLLPVGSGPDEILPEMAAIALTGLAELADKHSRRKANMFPFYGIPAGNKAGSTIRGDLGLKQETDMEIVALNMKRGWWRLFDGSNADLTGLEGFIDAIKLGEGAKKSLPDGFFGEKVGMRPAEPELEPEVEPTAPEPTAPANPEPPAEPAVDADPDHDEL